MKKLFITLIAIAICNISWSQKNETIVRYSGEPIYGLIASGAFDIRISQGEETSLKIEAREDLVSKLSIDKTEEGFIRLNYGSEVGKYFTGKNRPYVTVVVKELRNLNLSGVCVAIGKGEYTSTDRCAVIVGGSASLEFINIGAPKVSLDVNGSAIVGEFTVTTSELRVDVNGTAKASIKGTAGESTLNTSGTASLDALNLVTPQIKAVVSGMSLIKANVSGTADVTRSGTASFKYIGSGKISGDAKPL